MWEHGKIFSTILSNVNYVQSFPKTVNNKVFLLLLFSSIWTAFASQGSELEPYSLLAYKHEIYRCFVCNLNYNLCVEHFL